MGSLHIGALAGDAFQTQVNVIANNLANAGTTGYKQQRAGFSDLIYVDHKRMGSDSSSSNTIIPAGLQVGTGVRVESTYRIFSQGDLERTDDQLDLALQGKGFFSVELPSGETAYTRDGSFSLNQDGEIVTLQGYRVLPGITVPSEATSISISNTGQVEVTLDGQVAPQQLGEVEVAIFPNERGLHAEGENLFTETAASGAPVIGVAGDNGFPTLLQGYRESSNVKSVKELTSLILAQRLFELNMTMLRKSDEMYQTINQNT